MDGLENGGIPPFDRLRVNDGMALSGFFTNLNKPNAPKNCHDLEAPLDFRQDRRRIELAERGIEID